MYLKVRYFIIQYCIIRITLVCIIAAKLRMIMTSDEGVEGNHSVQG